AAQSAGRGAAVAGGAGLIRRTHPSRSTAAREAPFKKEEDYRNPRNSYLPAVLNVRQGLPSLLALVDVARQSQQTPTCAIDTLNARPWLLISETPPPDPPGDVVYTRSDAGAAEILTSFLD